jgi:hypothetical protein
LEGIIKEFQDNLKKLTEGTKEAIINSMKSRMPFLGEEIHTRIRLIFKA